MQSLKNLPRKTRRKRKIPQLFELLFKRFFIVLLRPFISKKRIDFPLLDNIRNILVVRQHDQLGDMLCAVPLLRALRKNFPQAQITLVASPVNAAIMLNHPCVDKVLTYNKVKWRDVVRFIHMLRKTSYDLAVVPITVSSSLTSDLIALLSRASYRIGGSSLNGQKNPSAFCYTTLVDLKWISAPHRHQTQRNLDILKPFGITTENLEHEIGLTSDEIMKAQKFLFELRHRNRLIVGFHPGAGKPENRWGAKQFAHIANKVFNEFQAGIVITVGPMDDEPFEEMKNYLDCQFLALYKKPLREVAAIINELDLFVTNDTGILHVAAGTNANVLALFGPTDAMQWAPLGKKNRYIASKDGKISSISVEEVYTAISLILNENRKET